MPKYAITPQCHNGRWGIAKGHRLIQVFPAQRHRLLSALPPLLPWLASGGISADLQLNPECEAHVMPVMHLNDVLGSGEASRYRAFSAVNLAELLRDRLAPLDHLDRCR